ncbi:MAG: hypothetical protein CEE38_20485 [Planctomycetes bacterium B3_Pla]|nr:MAG: hypothetical protein CEE38_20485 [Planctomycetes bacterium B3_Pla]
MRIIQQNQADLRTLERSIELLNGDTGVTTTQSQPKHLDLIDTSEPPASRYSGLGKQAAVELFLQENGVHWYKASVVAKELIRRGMRPTSKTWATAITGALNRATDKGLAEKEKMQRCFHVPLQS